ncbi:sigma-70 family RNA polymerase sigma factor [Bacillus cereus BAG1O-3]|uniref:sigma factor-like helix-turn-helix DNA-binding protein n=1 Tax=Bacillus cereus group TaxID=86661 RepID=UPI000354766E|nr:MULTISPECIES: sigma factor-like helix-turn-helix DNA-binding protein [Bacillus cereus group]EPF11114.1 sigma-70 family RNA polymerase sigma factor [Bacillus cereus BAG1O-3]MDR4413736.1 RNA polymerase subunit sigma-24 [Bacillus thuringiensis]PGX81378.1 RNA polymerase subunit sigma-24 [Bacillus thuringiensis]HDR8062562.1 RNA polymerase subunit sigma-24 [Bacillus cereus]
MEELIKQYKKSLKDIKKSKETAGEEELRIYSEMISDLEFALEWMQTARRPGNRRGIERRAAYQREKVCDPLLMQRYFRSMDDNGYEWDNHQQENMIDEWEKVKLEDALSLLTKREKEVYLMSRGYCLTYRDIAKYLMVSSSTVQTMIERAEKKIARHTRESLFCNCG